tara:strand:- start:8309 stop:9247 length:939 start_codon:yes stop_codon:yes gene_type:complete
MQSSSGSTSTTHTRHVPVLLQEVLKVLNIQKDDTVLDGTLGGGGHAHTFAHRLTAKGKLIGFDVDSAAVERTRKKLKGVSPTVVLIHDTFRNVKSQLADLNTKVDVAFFDLGWSSDQLEVSGRGFSFDRDEPLTMTLRDDINDSTLTAAEIVNTWDEEHIADIIYGWGEERASRKIARAIIEARKNREISTTGELVDIITSVLPRKGKRNPATKTFQALRIAVNDELGALQDILSVLPDITHNGARVAFLTFHSLEDKLVKDAFRAWEREGKGRRIIKKPLSATAVEVGHNPRSRSAKLRAFTFTHYANNTK